MEAIFPITALAKEQQAVKDAARNDVVRITERGCSAWIFASEEAFDRRIEEAVENALYEARIEAIVMRGMKDYEEGRFVAGTETARAELEKMRLAR